MEGHPPLSLAIHTQQCLVLALPGGMSRTEPTLSRHPRRIGPTFLLILLPERGRWLFMTARGVSTAIILAHPMVGVSWQSCPLLPGQCPGVYINPFIFAGSPSFSFVLSHH
ncbi:hypothetical protein HRR83_003919 [Exophiala dermatitidis]|uniref:Uncharacterized protein n=1 Tax=Exophiala dermatitidis TaxID=5970 RepID=A0AAN6EY18_EXODE|nr:hypothetical protein HRR74_002697 [Exophiala dermatitidis]KAJ4529443.1 hypothetical protein HRR73_000466 [Exophiala dermatitidis]KAJ4543902.1 hypothetical protein HRR76_001961 [Exophiala dermatitidis]KAJ4549078.1 hypothetical protein HRR77_003956 [Exophiala dermatitidis]KAJ4575368.1 hypothetical protein HRR79_002290 [Exophiala dermatitidis]